MNEHIAEHIQWPAIISIPTSFDRPRFGGMERGGEEYNEGEFHYEQPPTTVELWILFQERYNLFEKKMFFQLRIISLRYISYEYESFAELMRYM